MDKHSDDVIYQMILDANRAENTDAEGAAGRESIGSPKQTFEQRRDRVAAEIEECLQDAYDMAHGVGYYRLAATVAEAIRTLNLERDAEGDQLPPQSAEIISFPPRPAGPAAEASPTVLEVELTGLHAQQPWFRWLVNAVRSPQP